MRYKLGKLQGQEKHSFTAKLARYGSYVNKTTGESHNTILFTEIKSEDGTLLTDHAWVKEDSYIKALELKRGTVYKFEARVGVYKRGRTSKDYQLRKIRQVKVA